MPESRERALATGHAGIMATDTVYGLVAKPATPGYAHIFELKQRPLDQALAWIIRDPKELETYARDIPDYAWRLAQMFWPGPLTLVLHASDVSFDTGDLETNMTIALRCPDDANALELLCEIDSPLACTSANLHGEPTPVCSADLPACMLALPGGDALPATCDLQPASTIVDCTGEYPRTLREGPIPEQVIYDVAVYGATLAAH